MVEIQILAKKTWFPKMVAQNFGLASTSNSVHINTVYEKPSRNINFLMMAEDRHIMHKNLSTELRVQAIPCKNELN